MRKAQADAANADSRHIKNVSVKVSVVANYATTANDGKTDQVD
jgi:hypothetical protein